MTVGNPHGNVNYTVWSSQVGFQCTALKAVRSDEFLQELSATYRDECSAVREEETHKALVSLRPIRIILQEVWPTV